MAAIRQGFELLDSIAEDGQAWLSGAQRDAWESFEICLQNQVVRDACSEYVILLTTLRSHYMAKSNENFEEKGRVQGRLGRTPRLR